MTPSSRLLLVLPKGVCGFILLLATCVLGGRSAPRDGGPQSVLAALGLMVLPLVLLLTMPEKWLAHWLQTPRFIRRLLLALAAYVMVVTASGFQDLHTFRLWGDLLLPGGLAPWTPAHAAGLSAALTAFTSQKASPYVTPPLPPDTEVLVRGADFIPFDEARRQAAALNAESSAGTWIPPIEDPSKN